jgi:hypothetical protein
MKYNLLTSACWDLRINSSVWRGLQNSYTEELRQPGSCLRTWYSFSWSGSSLPLLNPYVLYRVHEHKPMDPYPAPDAYSPHIRALPIYNFMTHYSVMLPSKLVSPILSLPFVSLLLFWFEYTAYLLHSTIFPIRVTRPAHFIHTVITFRGRCDDR